MNALADCSDNKRTILPFKFNTSLKFLSASEQMNKHTQANKQINLIEYMQRWRSALPGRRF